MATEELIVKDEWTPLDLLLFRRFRQEVPGLLEDTLNRNRGLAALGLFLPVGTKVVVRLPEPQETEVQTVIKLWD
jgi:phage tail protein X